MKTGWISLFGAVFFFNIAQAADVEYRVIELPSGKFHLFKIDPAKLNLHWRDDKQQPIRTLTKLKSELSKKGKKTVFMMNAGIFEPGGIPTGLHIENGKELRPLVLREGRGNFFLKPNGVLSIDPDGKARILESTQFSKANLKPRLAVQSGPLLLENGKIHPAFQMSSKNRKHRNGVGILPDGKLLFAMTDIKSTRVNLHQFASMFRHFKCEDALFLDGDLSTADADLPGEKNDLKHNPDQELAPGAKTGDQLGAMFSATVAE